MAKYTQYYTKAYNATGRKRSGVFTPTPAKRVRLTPISQRSRITDTQGSRFTPRVAMRRMAMSNLRRRLRRTPLRIRKLRAPGGYGAAFSKSSGFIKTPIRVKKSGRSVVQSRGVSIVIEKGGVVDAGANTALLGNTVAIGHCNVPLELAHLMFWRAVVKAALAKQGCHDLSNFYSSLDNVRSGDWFRVEYRIDNDQTMTTYEYVSDGSTSAEDIAQAMHTKFWNFGSQIELFQFVCLPFQMSHTGAITPYTKLSLRGGRFVFYGKSTLKIQNRTISNVGGDEESVDNVPLHGKAYYGRGSGTAAVTKDTAGYLIAASTFWCDDTSGTMAKVPLDLTYQEPVPASQFDSVISTGKVLLDPGNIRTSVLDGKFTVGVNKMYRTLFVTGTALTHTKSTFGNFRFMLLEKMINSVTGTTTNSIKVAYEHNIRFGGYFVSGRPSETAQLNELALLANEA